MEFFAILRHLIFYFIFSPSPPHVDDISFFFRNGTWYTFQHKMRYWAINTIFIGLQTSYVHDVNIINPFIVITFIFYAILLFAKKEEDFLKEGRVFYTKAHLPSLFEFRMRLISQKSDVKQIHTQSSSFLPVHMRVRILLPLSIYVLVPIDTYNVIINFCTLSQVTHRLFIIYKW